MPCVYLPGPAPAVTVANIFHYARLLVPGNFLLAVFPRKIFNFSNTFRFYRA